MRTLKQLAQEALDIQDACNLSGVAYAFGRMMNDLCELGLHTEQRNTHPIVTLYLDKMNSLNGIQELGNINVFKAYNECEKLTK
jgi:hypothetical protein